MYVTLTKSKMSFIKGPEFAKSPILVEKKPLERREVDTYVHGDSLRPILSIYNLDFFLGRAPTPGLWHRFDSSAIVEKRCCALRRWGDKKIKQCILQRLGAATCQFQASLWQLELHIFMIHRRSSKVIHALNKEQRPSVTNLMWVNWHRVWFSKVITRGQLHWKKTSFPIPPNKSI